MFTGRLYSTSAAARELGVSQNYVRLLIHRGTLRGERTDVGFIITEDELNRIRETRKAR